MCLSWWQRLLRLLRLKRSDPVRLDAGILIIGSLLWDRDEIRQQWRDERLDCNQSELVSAPIRYGRRSGERRGHTYTMVFSRSAPAGHARVVRCSHPITSADDLTTEALRPMEIWHDVQLSRYLIFSIRRGRSVSRRYRSCPCFLPLGEMEKAAGRRR